MTLLRRLIALLLGLTVALVATGCTPGTAATTDLAPPSSVTVALLNGGAAHPPGTKSLAEALPQAIDHQITIEQASTHQQQLDQLKALDGQQVGILLVQPVDASRVGEALEPAAKAGWRVIIVGEAPADLGSVSLVITWDEFSIGEQEVAAVAATLDTSSTKHLEVFGGDPDLRSATARFNGAILALKGLGEEGRMTVKSGRTSIQSSGVRAGDQGSLINRLRTTYRVTYPRHELSAVIIPEDSMAPAVRQLATSLRATQPKLLSSGATEAGVREVMAGTMFSTQYRDPMVLAELVAKTLPKLADLGYNPLASKRNRLRSTPGVFVSPALVTQQNAADVLKDNPVLGPLTNKA